jgi:hypothetical protein
VGARAAHNNFVLMGHGNFRFLILDF